VVNYFLLNAEVIMISKVMQFDDYNDNVPELIPTDPIYKEYDSVYNKISSNFFIKPEGRLNLTLNKENPSSFYILFKSHLKSRPIDTIMDYAGIYYISLKRTQFHLDSSIKKLQFKRNKLIFKTYLSYCNKLIEYDKTTDGDTSSVNRYIRIGLTTFENPNKPFGLASFYNLPKNFTTTLDSANLLAERLVEKSTSSEMITYYTLGFLFYPASKIIDE
jgi:hypothetical protein